MIRFCLQEKENLCVNQKNRKSATWKKKIK